jgi:hypothetical protein
VIRRGILGFITNRCHDATTFVRPLTDAKRQHLEAGWRSSNAFILSASSGQALHRCQILLPSARGERAPQMAHHLGCDEQTVGNAIRAFNRAGLECLSQGSPRPYTDLKMLYPEDLGWPRPFTNSTPRPRPFGLAQGRPGSLPRHSKAIALSWRWKGSCWPLPPLP